MMIKMKQWLQLSLLALALAGCEQKPPVDPPVEVERTIFVYMPWSTDLLSYFRTNLEDLKASIVANRIRTDRFVVSLSESSTRARLFELKYENLKITEVPLKSYDSPAFTTAEGITGILRDMKATAPSPAYSMIIGSHGVGWVPVGSRTRAPDFRPHWEYEGVPLTRFFGGKTTQYQTDITTLARGIADAGLTMDYILFDDCYMANVETAYDLKEATNYLIGCPTEVMGYGFPYRLIGEHLTGAVDYEGVAEGFYRFYSAYVNPYGTVAVIDCSELEALASVMREINSRFTLNPSRLGEIQRMDGYTPVLFYDLGDYVDKLCDDPALLARFREQLERTAPARYKRHTPMYYSMNMGPTPIRAYSGITVSDPSGHGWAAAKNTTAWWQATH
jgi:hypothetical protein